MIRPIPRPSRLGKLLGGSDVGGACFLRIRTNRQVWLTLRQGMSHLWRSIPHWIRMKQSDQSHHTKDRHSTCGPKNRREVKRFVEGYGLLGGAHWSRSIPATFTVPSSSCRLPSGCYDASSMSLVYVIL